MSAPWAHLSNKGVGWLSCLLEMCLIKDIHFAAISSLKPCLVELAHQCKWFRTPLIHWLILSQPFCLLSVSIFFPIDLATCQVLKKCDLSRENVPCEIRLNGRVRGKLTGDSRLVKSFSRLKRTIERLQNVMERVSSRAQRA